MTLVSLVCEAAARRPNAQALRRILGGDRVQALSYGELLASVHHLAASLHERGLRPGECVGIYMGQTIEAAVAMLAAQQLGAVFYPLHLQTPFQMAVAARRTESRVVLIDNVTLFRLASAPREVVQTSLVHVSLEEPTPRQGECIASLGADCVRLLEAGEEPPEPVAAREAADDRPACVLFTSGSTGEPKGVVISEANLRARVTGEVDAYELSSADKLLNILGFAFDVGVNQLFSSLVAGAELVILNSFLAADMEKSIHQVGVDGVSGVPLTWVELLKLGDERARACFERLRYFTISGGNLPEETLLEIRRLAPRARIYKTYGQTETFRSCMLLPDEFDRKALSVGRPVPGARVQVRRVDGQPAAPGEIGEVVHSGAGTMLRYLEESHVRTEVSTGDIGYLDEDGYLFLKGRKDRMLKIRSCRVYPEETADAIKALPGVSEAVVFGEPGPDGRMDLVAVVESPAEGAELVPELRRLLGQRIAPFMMPAKFHVVATIPRTSSGKPDIPAVESRYREAG